MRIGGARTHSRRCVASEEGSHGDRTMQSHVRARCDDPVVAGAHREQREHRVAKVIKVADRVCRRARDPRRHGRAEDRAAPRADRVQRLGLCRSPARRVDGEGAKRLERGAEMLSQRSQRDTSNMRGPYGGKLNYGGD